MNLIKYSHIIQFILTHVIFIFSMLLFSFITFNGITSFLFFFIITFVYLYFFFSNFLKKIFFTNNNRIVKIVMIIFISRCFFGTSHEILFFGLDNMENSTSSARIYEEQWMHNMLIKYSDPDTEKTPIFTLSPILENGVMRDKNAELHYYNSIVYRSFGNYSKNIIIWNSLHIVFICTFLSLITLQLSNSQIYGVRALILSGLYPSGLFTNMMYRDIVGQAFLCFGALLFFMSIEKGYLKYILSTIFLCLCSYTLREPYVALVLAWAIILSLRKLLKNHPIIIMSSIIIISLFLFAQFYLLFQIVNIRYGAYDPFGFSFLNILKNIKVFLFGVFPMYQIFLNVDGAVWHSQLWLVTIYNWIIYFIIIINFKKIVRSNLIAPLILSLFFIFSLLMSAAFHIDYLVPGILFLIPIISRYQFSFKTLAFFSSIFFIFLNLAYYIFSMALTGNPTLKIF